MAHSIPATRHVADVERVAAPEAPRTPASWAEVARRAGAEREHRAAPARDPGGGRLARVEETGRHRPGSVGLGDGDAITIEFVQSPPV
ncbi:MAG: hypothetical protein WKF41_01195 [Gaiellaceae bacterium]